MKAPVTNDTLPIRHHHQRLWLPLASTIHEVVSYVRQHIGGWRTEPQWSKYAGGRFSLAINIKKQLTIRLSINTIRFMIVSNSKGYVGFFRCASCIFASVSQLTSFQGCNVKQNITPEIAWSVLAWQQKNVHNVKFMNSEILWLRCKDIFFLGSSTTTS